MAISPVERGHGLNVLPTPAGYSVDRAYASYLRVASLVQHVTITNHDRSFMPDQFPGIAMTLVREASFVRENASYTGMPAFTILGVMDAAAVVGGTYIAERETHSTSTHVRFPQDVQDFLDKNDVLRHLQAEMIRDQAQPNTEYRELARRSMLVKFFNRVIGNKRVQLQGKFDGWELAVNDYMLGVDLLLRRWQSISTQA